MTTLTPEQVADLRRKIEAKYQVCECVYGDWMVLDTHSWNEVSGNDHDDPLDAEAEMEAIIQDEVAAAMEAAEEEEEPAS